MPGVREVIEAVGARLLYLPPYSPDFNPIEQLFANSKRYYVRPPSARSKASNAVTSGPRCTYFAGLRKHHAVHPQLGEHERSTWNYDRTRARQDNSSESRVIQQTDRHRL
jgi:transposase